jgi:hypothetical protein
MRHTRTYSTLVSAGKGGRSRLTQVREVLSGVASAAASTARTRVHAHMPVSAPQQHINSRTQASAPATPPRHPHTHTTTPGQVLEWLVGGTNTSSGARPSDDAAAALAAASRAWDGVLVFDECHRAKNFVPGKEAQSTKVCVLRACAAAQFECGAALARAFGALGVRTTCRAFALCSLLALLSLHTALHTAGCRGGCRSRLPSSSCRRCCPVRACCMAVPRA